MILVAAQDEVSGHAHVQCGLNAPLGYLIRRLCRAIGIWFASGANVV